jgi:hypothetical protein
MRKILRYVIVLLLPVVLNSAAASQQLVIKTKNIELLIEEWNILHNARKLKAFESVYGKELLFYAESVARKDAIMAKRKLFNRRSDYRQRITTDIAYTAYADGIVKCEFTKEVLQNSKWKAFPSYVLVRYEGTRYWIVGESDYATDKRAGFSLKLGEPLEMEIISKKINSTVSDSALRKQILQIPASMQSAASNQMITVPKDYVFILMGILIVSGILIFISETVRINRQKREALIAKRIEKVIATQAAASAPSIQNNHAVQPAHVVQAQPVPTNHFVQPGHPAQATQPARPAQSAPGVQSIPNPQPAPGIHALPVNKAVQHMVYTHEDDDIIRPVSRPVSKQQEDEDLDEPYQLIENQLKQSAFRNFVIGLFEASRFSHVKERPNQETSNGRDRDWEPVLEFHSDHHGGGIQNINVQCLYREDTGETDVKLFSEECLRFNRQANAGTPLYYLIGIGGPPDKPNRLYLIPGRELTKTFISTQALQPFRKTGSFIVYKGMLK